jgi:hypothetical protein
VRWSGRQFIGCYIVCFALVAVSRGQDRKVNSMATDPYINRATLQLFETPDASSKALESARQQPPPPPQPEDELPIESARIWAETILKSTCVPPKATSFLMFRREAGQFDVIRTRYKLDVAEVEVAQTKHVLSIRITGFRRPPGTSDLAAAEQAARAFLAGSERFQFEKLGEFAHGTYGRKVPSARDSGEAKWPHWVETMHWWVNNNEQGFWTVKATGGPTRAPIGPAEEINRYWP